jgi:hypothetical protein
MSQAHLYSLFLVIASLATAPDAGIAANKMPANDSITLPPASRVVESKNGTFRFRIYTTDNWRTPFPRGSLSVGSTSSGQRVVWQGKLPHHYGPRFTLVTKVGDVILLDGWLNIKPVYAVTILNPNMGSLVSFSYEDVVRTLRVLPSVLAEKARFGSWWMTSKPSLNASENLALIAAGDKMLIVDIRQAKIYAKP